jgi:hypothetical protein
MLEVVFAQLRAMKDNWHSEAARRRKVTSTDPVADTIDYCAGEAEQLLARLEEDTTTLSPSEFGKLHKTSPQTVTAWCRSGKIAGAVPNGRSWRIPRSARAPRRRAVRA